MSKQFGLGYYKGFSEGFNSVPPCNFLGCGTRTATAGLGGVLVGLVAPIVVKKIKEVYFDSNESEPEIEEPVD